MEDIIKVEFKDEESFTIFYITDEVFETEEEFKLFFKYLDNILKNRYNYELNGFYDVFIYFSDNLYILDFIYIDDFGNKDFNVTMYLNTTILYEFYDSDLISCKKIYYNNKYYTEIANMINDIRLFEYGNIIYGKEAEKIINRGLLIT